MDEVTIQDISSVSELFSTEFLDELFGVESDFERARLVSLAALKAKELKVPAAFKEVIAPYKKAEREINRQYEKDRKEKETKTSIAIPDPDGVPLRHDSKGRIENCIENYRSILTNDAMFKDRMYKNLLCDTVELHSDNKVCIWSDIHDARAYNYIEKKYGLFDRVKYEIAASIVFDDNSYNPAKDIIEGIEWDGNEHLKTLFQKYLKAEDTQYVSECCRLLFAGALNRLYYPGCKFDDTIVFQGYQGSGKSTFVKWLAINDSFYRSVKDIEEKDGMEVLRGAWFVELEEMVALKRARDSEGVKAYLTRTSDYYRAAYGKRVEEQKRQVIFLGTTNDDVVYSDPTGGRRYFPVKCELTRADGYELFDKEAEVRAEIMQCWGEAYALFLQGKMKPVASRSLLEVIEEKQREVADVDPIDGMAEKHLEHLSSVSVIELAEKLFGDIGITDYKKRRSVGAILKRLGWIKSKRQTGSGNKYGRQTLWVRGADAKGQANPDELPF